MGDQRNKFESINTRYQLDFFESWLDSTTEFLFFKDPKGYYMNVARATAELAGFHSAEEMFGKTDYDIYPRELAAVFQEQDKKVLITKKTVKSEDWINHATRGRILVGTVKSPFYDKQGNIIGIQGIARDITETRKLQTANQVQKSQLDAILNNIPLSLWIKDVDNCYLTVNKEYERFYNVNKLDVFGTSISTVLAENKLADDATIQKFQQDDIDVMKNKKTKQRRVILNINGQRRAIEIIKAPVISRNDEIIGLIGMSRDVTNNVQYERSLVKSKEEAEKASKTKSTFLANMSHEIRTPMNGIIGFLQLLEGTELDEEQKDFVKEARQSSETLLALLNDILDLSKVEAGKMAMEQISFNLRYVMEDVATLASSSVKNKPVEINALCYSNVPERVIGDPSRLKQVLNNFLNNAVKFTEKGEVNLTLKLLEQKNDTVKIEFEIRDTGIGISQENQKKIFDAFSQADDSTTRKYGGTGLGLTICRDIVELMNGTVSLESTQGEGSAFSFTACFKIDKTDEEKLGYNFPDITDKKILVIDDNETNLKVVSHYLAEGGCQITTAKNAKNALDILNSADNKFDIILTDYCMPDVDGMEFSMQAKKIEACKNTPIFLLTSRTRIGDYKAAKEHCLSGYLPKPIRKRDLIECIAIVFEKNVKNNDFITQHTVKEIRHLQTAKILLAEDNLINKKLMVKMFAKAGVNVDVASNGKEAVEAFEKNYYDMIFMDSQMPVMNGLEATEKIRASKKDTAKIVPIIALSANMPDENNNQFINAGMNDFVIKPVIYENLIRILDKYIPDKPKNTEKRDEENSNNALYQIEGKSDVVDLIVADLNISQDDALGLIDDFILEAKSKMKTLKQAISENDYEKIVQIAHSLRGASGNLRINALYEAASNLEIMAKERKLDEPYEIYDSMVQYLKFLSK